MIDVIHIAVCMKPLEGNFAENAIARCVSGLNVDGCRVNTMGEITAYPPLSTNENHEYQRPWNLDDVARAGFEERREEAHKKRDAFGRWPANLTHDGSDEVVGLFPTTTSKGHTPKSRGAGGLGCNGHTGQDGVPEQWHGSGSASRFFQMCEPDVGGEDEG